MVEQVDMGLVAIVDDDVVYVRGIKRALARRDVPVELSTFTRGDDAVTALCRDSAVDIALVDLRLPGLDGYEVCRQIKAAHPETFVAIASAHLSAEARIAAMEAGADCAVAKPYDVLALIEHRKAMPPTSSAVELLSSDHLEMAKNIAGSLARRYGSFISPDDIDGLALLGLCEAAARYDASKNGLFIAFAGSRIRGSVLDEVRKMSAKSRTDHARDVAATEARRTLAEENKDTSDKEVAAMLGCNIGQLQKVRASWVRLPTQEMRRLPSNLPEMDEVLETAQQKREVLLARGELAGVEADVIRLHYDQGMSIPQIAVQLGVPERKVMQVHARSVSRLRDIVGRSSD